MAKVITYILGFLIGYSIIGCVFMLVWNWLIVGVFGIFSTINFWQAVGFTILWDIIKNNYIQKIQ